MQALGAPTPTAFQAQEFTLITRMDRRVFVAVEIADTARVSVASHVMGLDTGQDYPVRWVKPENLHLTLRFFARASETDVDSISNAMASAARRTPPFEIVLEDTGVFPTPAKAKVLWIGISEPAELVALKSDIDRHLEDQGFEKESRNFRPHLTIARMRNSERGKELAAAHLEKQFGPVRFRVPRIILLESVLSRSGPDYFEIQSAELAG